MGIDMMEMRNIYDALCLSLTTYEAADPNDDYDPGAFLYEEVLDAVNRLEKLLF